MASSGGVGEEGKAHFEQYERGMEAKRVGNEAFKTGNIDEAIRSYKRVVLVTRGMPGATPDMAALGIPQIAKRERAPTLAEKKMVTDLLSSTYSNLALMYLKKGDCAKAMKYGKLSVQFDDTNVKGMHRIAQAYMKTGKWFDAEEWLERAIRCGGPNKALTQALTQVQKETRRSKFGKGFAAGFAKSFSGGDDASVKPSGRSGGEEEPACDAPKGPEEEEATEGACDAPKGPEEEEATEGSEAPMDT